MISLFREFTKSWIFKALMGLLVLSFAVFGLRDVFSRVSDNVVIKAGERQMTTADFRKRYDTYRKQMVENGQKAFTTEEFVAAGQDAVMVEVLERDMAFSAWLDKLGIKPSAHTVVEQISKVPAFFNQVTGKFDKDTYRQVLGNAGMTQAEYEQTASDQIAGQQYINAALTGLKTPRIYAAAQAAVMLQTRDASVMIVSDRNVALPARPTDADIQAFYKAKASLLSRPEIRQASVVQFGPRLFESSIQASDEDLRKLYQASLAKLATPETRSYVKVTAPDAGAAAKISAALKDGQDPQAAAKAAKGTVITYDFKPKTAEPDTVVADAAFALKTGEVSGPIKGELGFAVVKMGDIRIGSTPSFDSVKASLLDEYRKEKAADKVNELVNEFQKAHDNGEDFAAIAKRLNLPVHQLDPMTAEGKTGKIDPSTGQPLDYSGFPTLVQDVFALMPGSSSDVEELGHGEYVALRLDSVTPAGVLPLDDQLKVQLAGAWMQEQIATAVGAKADDVVRRLNAGEDFAKVAAELKAPIEHVTVDRTGRDPKVQQLGQAFMNRAFVTDMGKTFQVPVAPTAVVIGRVDAVHQADVGVANTIATQMSARMSQTISSDINDMTYAEAAKAVKSKTFIDNADRALDVAPKGKDAKGKDAKAKS